MHLVSGNPQLLPHSLPMANERSPIPELRIMQRMRLEAQQLDGVTRRMQLREEHCILVALPCGQDRNHIMDQSNILNSAFINYLQQKQAAGIVHVAPVGSTSTQPAYIVHVFPPCDFAQQALMSTACDFFQSILDRQTAFLFVVVTTAQQT
uniref:SPOC domain-containing protein n=1 Tax=Romanomermis culicivorax TaxID=13658 RepID=A0A915J2U8_ROMCU